MPRAPRRLSARDAALWQAYVQTIVPLPGRALPPPPAAPAPPEPTPEPTPQSAGKTRAAKSPPPPPSFVSPEEPPPGLDRRRWKALSRGQMRPERTLDLHGRTVQQAHALLIHFLHHAQGEGVRCVAVITGKGPSETGGILRRELPHWLNGAELRPLILATAHPQTSPLHQANRGAVHLLLRRVADPRARYR